jgi:hypothetical protein
MPTILMMKSKRFPSEVTIFNARKMDEDNDSISKTYHEQQVCAETPLYLAVYNQSSSEEDISKIDGAISKVMKKKSVKNPKN